MFSSLASYIFGTNKEEHIPEKNLDQVTQDETEAQTTIHVTSLSPSVSGDTNKKYIKQKSAKSKRKQNSTPVDSTEGDVATVAANGEKNGKENNNDDDNFIEDDWFIVDHEDEIKSLVSADSEEDLTVEKQLVRCSTPILEVAKDVLPSNIEQLTPSIDILQGKQRRRQYLIEINALYNGPRHQQQRNYLQRQRNGAIRGNNQNKSACAGIKAASVERDVPLIVPESEDEEKSDNGIMTQSLYFGDNYGVNSSMDESWFMTPPPCFTSIGPSNMETSPFENLLIEHPSMSVYHSIRSAQRAEARESNSESESVSQHETLEVEQRPQMAAGPRVDRFATIELKKQIFAKNAQKSKQNMERQKLSRGATKRANKISEGKNKNHRPRRSELQHSKVFSNSNNNRKICY